MVFLENVLCLCKVIINSLSVIAVAIIMQNKQVDTDGSTSLRKGMRKPAESPIGIS